MAKDEIDWIVPVGGGSNMYVIKNALEKFFGQEMPPPWLPGEAIARGAALIASGSNPKIIERLSVSIGVPQLDGKMKKITTKRISTTSNIRTINNENKTRRTKESKSRNMGRRIKIFKRQHSPQSFYNSTRRKKERRRKGENKSKNRRKWYRYSLCRK